MIKNPALTKGSSTHRFGNKKFYYAGRTLYSSKARLTALELAERGIKAMVTQSKGMGNLIWTDKVTHVDLSEPITGYYRNPKFKTEIKDGVRDIYTKRPTLRIGIFDPENPDHYIDYEWTETTGEGRTKEGALKYLKSWAIKRITELSKNTSNPKSTNMTKALSMKARYKEDLIAGHKDAAEYWRGQASAYFTGNPTRSPEDFYYSKIYKEYDHFRLLHDNKVVLFDKNNNSLKVVSFNWFKKLQKIEDKQKYHYNPTTNPRVSVSECPKCHRKMGEKHKTTTKIPSIARMEKWMDDGVARATDGCRVEPDGICEHGHSSWLMVLGYI